MLGEIDDIEGQGIIPRMVRTVFSRIDSANENVEFSVKVSMAQIYNEAVDDLIEPNKQNLKVFGQKGKGKGVFIKGIAERYVCDEQEVFQIMKAGNKNRITASTKMNKESSRSHSLFILTITVNNKADDSCKTGKLYLVDLAGSESNEKTGAVGQTAVEAKNINLSLLTLRKVINSLIDKSCFHVPYNDSKLTRILSESIGGNSKTCLIINCSPSPFNDLETLNSLRFGGTARNVKNQPKVNREYTVPELK